MKMTQDQQVIARLFNLTDIRKIRRYERRQLEAIRKFMKALRSI